MNLLIIGGTQFVGRAIVEEALARGHRLTLLHRGQTNPDLFQRDPRVEHRLGDRKGDLAQLAEGDWDAVVDCVGYEPRPVRASSLLLTARVGMYAFISTISVYADSLVEIDEHSPVLELPEGASRDQFTMETYGALKFLCENEVRAAYGSRALIIRAGLQIGPNDHTDRFSDWVERISKRDRVLVPGGPPMPWQLIDSRDTARFVIHSLEHGCGGTFNVTGEQRFMPDVLDAIRGLVNPQCVLAEAEPEWLTKHGIKSWVDLALWMPEAEREGLMFRASIREARKAGLALRALEETVTDIRERVAALPADRPRRGGLAADREDELLAKLGGG